MQYTHIVCEAVEQQNTEGISMEEESSKWESVRKENETK